MISFVETSIAYRISLWAGNIYKNSALKKVLSTLGYWYKNSKTHKAFYNYLNRKSSFRYTLTYRVLSSIGRLLDMAVGKIHDFFAEQIRTSSIMALLTNLKKEASSSSFLLITAVLSFTAGYSVTNTFRNRWSTLKLEGVLAMCAVCIIIGIMSGKWKTSTKNSLFVKLYHFIWE